MKKLLILVPVWKRPEILKLFLSRLTLPSYLETRVLFILSPEDPFYVANTRLVKDYNYFSHKNRPLGEKKNEALHYSLKWDWDFFMDLGSDNIIHFDLWKLYEPYFENEKYFGINNAYVYDTKTQKSLFVNGYHQLSGETFALGPGRVISRDIINELSNLWRSDWDCGMDGCSNFAIERLGYKNTVIDVGRLPYILDVKSATNLTPFYELEDMFEQVNTEWLKEQFNIHNLEIEQDYFTTIEIDDFHKRVEEKTQVCGSKIDAFNQVNTEHQIAFGYPKYKNYNSYKVRISQIHKNR